MASDSRQPGSTIQTVTSADGTSIAFERHGRGPPLVLLHGSSGTRRSWDTLRPHLTDSFTVYVPDRRGRGDSGDADGYALAKEVADLRAVVEQVDGEPTVFGHSFGGLVTLAAASATSLGAIVLYEPAVLVGPDGDDLATRMERRLDEGRRREAMRLFLETAAGVPDVERLPFWPEDIDMGLAETVVRESYAVEAYDLPADPDVTAPTLLLTGEHGPDHLRDGVDTLDDRVSGSRLVELDGVGHVGTESAPERVATAVRSFVHDLE